MTTNLLRNLCSDNFRFCGHECLANFARLFVTLLLGYRVVGCDWNCVTGLSWNVDTFLTLYLDWYRHTLLSGDVLADLLTVMTSTVILQVGNPALHVFYRLAVLFVGSVQSGVTAGVEGRTALGLHGRGKAVLEDCFAFCLINSCTVLGEGGHLFDDSHVLILRVTGGVGEEGLTLKSEVVRQGGDRQ